MSNNERPYPAHNTTVTAQTPSSVSSEVQVMGGLSVLQALNQILQRPWIDILHFYALNLLFQRCHLLHLRSARKYCAERTSS